MSMPTLTYPFAVALGALTAFELAASSIAGNAHSCSFVMANTLSIPSTFVEYMDDRLVRRSDEPLWINDFAVEFEQNYFCRDSGFRYALALIGFICSTVALYQKFRGNRTQDMVIAAHIALGIIISTVIGFGIQQTVTGFVPAAVWIALVSMPLHLDEDWKQKQGYLRFE